MNWEGFDEELTGYLDTTGSGRSGGIEIDASDEQFSCTGDWQISAESTPGVPPVKGRWEITCTNGLAASGDYVADSPAQGRGSGQDRDGRMITFHYGP